MEWSLMWIALLLLAAVLEAITGKLIAIWFIPSSILSAALALFEVPIYWQITAYLSFASLCVLCLRAPAINAKNRAAAKNDLDSVVGDKCIVTERIDTFAGCGHARVKGQIWSARGLDQDDIFEPGEVLQIVGVEGVKLICKRM